MKKKIVILVPHGHQLANQLWNFISIYAYCLEKKYMLSNPSFFRYHRFFSFQKKKNFLSLFLSFLNTSSWQRARGFSYSLYNKYVAWLIKNKKNQIVADKKEPYIFYLPPSENIDSEYTMALSKLDNSSINTFYFSGWLFRNPMGIEKYRNEIIEYFRPKKAIQKKVENIISPLRKKYSTLVGVHIRQGDYKTFGNGKYFITQERVEKILEEYLQFSGNNNSKTIFVICSDEPIDKKIFTGLNVALPQGNGVEDLFTLAQTDIIIGSNSTYGAFASYFGNIPFIMFEHEKIDWNYYLGGKTYFENKKNTLTFY